jgi:hypothetical protein
MYILIGILFVICIISYVIHFYRRKHIIRKICQMDVCDKLCLFHRLSDPFGFCFLPSPDIMTSTLDAWQKAFGYCSLYDRSASRFNMVFDCEPVYFNYDNRTWLIEFWKGQYGINIGGEIGIYQADCVLSPDQYDSTLFHNISKNELFPISMTLYYKGARLFSISRNHWWLTGFRMGTYCEPEDLVMDIAITFPNDQMLQCFAESLKHMGYHPCALCICDMTISFPFSSPHSRQPRSYQCLKVKYSQWKNRLFCKLYLCITKPFDCTIDRLLYLYFFLPVSFRHMLLFKKNRRQRHKKVRKLRP